MNKKTPTKQNRYWNKKELLFDGVLCLEEMQTQPVVCTTRQQAPVWVLCVFLKELLTIIERKMQSVPSSRSQVLKTDFKTSFGRVL